MPLVDIKAIFMRARSKRPPQRKREPKPANAPQKCRRDKCYNTELVAYGLCRSCFDILKGTPKKRKTNDHLGERDPIEKEHLFRIGDIVMIAQSFREKRLQGLYAQVVSVEDEGAICTIELTGDCSDAYVTRAVRKMAGERVRIVAHFLLPVSD